MLAQMKDRKNDFETKLFNDCLNNIIPNDAKIRLLPIKTQDFAEKLQLYMTHNDDNIIDETVKLIQEGLLFKNFLSTEDVEIELFTNLKDKIKEAFDSRTIPAMYADMNGKIFLDDTKIGQIYIKTLGLGKFDIRAGKKRLILTKTLPKKTAMIEIMKDCFSKVIDNLFGPNDENLTPK